MHHGMERPIANVSWDMQYEMQIARKAFNIPPKEWEAMAGTPIWVTDGGLSKSDVIVLYRLENRTEAVTNDIQIKHIKRKRN